jgi:hypothetical protein
MMEELFNFRVLTVFNLSLDQDLDLDLNETKALNILKKAETFLKTIYLCHDFFDTSKLSCNVLR